MRAKLALALVFVPLWLPACSTSSEPESRPITPSDLNEIDDKHNAPTNMGRVEDLGTMFVTLDQNLRTWRDLMLSTDTNRKIELSSLEEAITRLVYNNFDVILAELSSDDPEHRVVAAGALGFSRIPGPDEPGGDPRFLSVHDRAVPALVAVLEEGNDQLTQNALLSLSRIGSDETPLGLMLEILIGHHNPDVRSNAALTLSHLLGPDETDIAIGSLYASLRDESPKVRLHVVSAIAALEDEKSQGQILSAFKHDSSDLVRANAAWVLGRIGNPRVIPILANGLIDKTAIVRVASYRSLCLLTGKDLGKTPRRWLEWYARNFDVPG